MEGPKRFTNAWIQQHIKELTCEGVKFTYNLLGDLESQFSNNKEEALAVVQEEEENKEKEPQIKVKKKPRTYSKISRDSQQILCACGSSTIKQISRGCNSC